MSSVDVPKTFGALLLGGLFASLLSGLVAVQVLLYFKMYPGDHRRLKVLVLWIWFLDTCHTGMIWAALWSYLIDHFGNAEGIDFIPWNLALTIVFTAILTFFVHCFFAHRIHMLSRHNWYLTAPIVVLAILRLVSASGTTAEMIRLHSFTAFKLRFRWIFTLGLALSSGVDVLITGSLFVLLHSSRTGMAGNLNAIIDSLIRYSFETGFLTCAGTVISMICWLAIPHNLIFMGLHFVIGKLYANSLLVTLNTRVTVRRAQSSRSQSSGSDRVPVHYLDTRKRPSSNSKRPTSPPERDDSISKISTSPKVLEISVERDVQYDA